MTKVCTTSCLARLHIPFFSSPLSIVCSTVALEFMSHLKWIIEHTSGKRVFMFTAQTPSDDRAMKNALSQLKRLCRDLVEKSRYTV